MFYFSCFIYVNIYRPTQSNLVRSKNHFTCLKCRLTVPKIGETGFKVDKKGETIREKKKEKSAALKYFKVVKDVGLFKQRYVQFPQRFSINSLTSTLTKHAKNMVFSAILMVKRLLSKVKFFL